MTCYFSIITPVKNDVWALSKTLKSIFSQSFSNVELIVIDGMSTDNTPSLVKFWQECGLISKYIRKEDESVYDAMNKGLRAANGKYILFMNCGDVFSSNDTLYFVYHVLIQKSPDALLGWGELDGQLWASWVVTKGFRMASLGFCHQALYVKREIIIKHPFDSRSFKTDSDTKQFASIIKNNHVVLLPEVLAIRGSDNGISADLDRSKTSINETITTYYKGINSEIADLIIAFRRDCTNPQQVFDLLQKIHGEAKVHLSLLILDTLFLRQSKSLSRNEIQSFFEKCIEVLDNCDSINLKKILQKLICVQQKQIDYNRDKNAYELNKKKQMSKLEIEISRKYEGFMPGEKCDDYFISLTSFPKRISSVYLVIESLFKQTRPPAKIFLNLGEDEINYEWIPNELRDLQAKGLIINFVKNTMHQYDKFLHTYNENKSRPMVIVDDDVIYPPRSMGYLLEKHEQFPDLVVANRAHRMRVDSKGRIGLYETWDQEVYDDQPSFSLIPTGAGGVLYPRCFFDDNLVCNKDLILRCAPYADDIWLKGCAMAKGIKTICSDMLINESWYYRYTPHMTEEALHKTNVDQGLNDMQIEITFRHLSSLISKNWPGFTTGRGNASV